MARRHELDESALDHILGKPVVLRTPRERRRDRATATLGVIGMVAFFWCVGWGHAVAEGLIVVVTAIARVVGQRYRRYEARREAARRAGTCTCAVCRNPRRLADEPRLVPPRPLDDRR